MARILHQFLKDKSGATAIEYGLIAGLVAVVIIAGLSSLGTAINGVMSTVAANVAAK